MRRFVQKAGFVLRNRFFLGIASFFRKFYWRILGMRIGKNTEIPHLFVTWPHKVSLGKNCRLEHGIYFKYDGIWDSGIAIDIGDNTFVGSHCEFNITKEIRIGRNGLIASGCRFIDHDHGYIDRTIPMNRSMAIEAPITIAEDVWIGCNAVILKGVTIGKGSIIAAGAVVNKSVPAYEIWGGIPAQKVGVRP